MAFGTKLSQEDGGSMSLSQFQAKWGIDEKCVEFLSGLPPSVLGVVLGNFYQRPDQTNASARCQAFAQSVLKRHRGGGGAAPMALPAAPQPVLVSPPALRTQPREPRMVPPPVWRRLDPLPPTLQINAPTPATVTRVKPPARTAPETGEDAVSRLLEFQATWNLDDSCMNFLGSLSPDLQMRIIAEFTHRPEQTNPSARCMAFAKKVQRAQEAVEGSPGNLSAFQANWGIDEACMAYLASLPEHVQATVLSTFEHRPDQTNVSARCQAYARSVMQRHSGGQAALVPPVLVPPPAARAPREAAVAPPPMIPRLVPASSLALPAPTPTPAPELEPLDLLQFQATWGLDDRCVDLLRSLPPEVRSIVVSKFEHKPGQTNPSARCQAFAKSIMNAQQGTHMLQDFQAKWGVDERCMELLASMPQQVQATIVTGFEHRPDQTNVSARCMAFARSVMQRYTQASFGPPLKVQRLEF